ncbi:uncharacterized protein LOC128354439 isoform X1 [Scomber scombrus]|uniref:Uncharacterized protein LOC128354439 isoform X1 n=1 Tax=Scomber scombrus TaxID=13677 RepID=A0AAV1PU11_SCOSC
MEWYGGTPDSYRQFTDRGSLNTSTGAMTITGLTPGESGIYTAEINNRVNSKTELLVISPVPKPSISVSCDTEKTYCDFTCDGSITGAAPVTYRWTAGEKRWPSTKELKITKEDKEEWFSCILENPVSSNSSEKVFNPFIEREGDRTWIYILVPVVAGIVVICIIIACFIYKCKKGKTDGYTFTGKTVDNTGKDMEVIPLHFEESPDQDPLSVVTLSNSNGPENRPLLSSAQETSNQDPTSGVAHDTGNDVLHEADQETSNQDLLSVVTPGTSNGPVIPTVCEVHETPTEDQGAVVSPDTSNELEKTVSLPAEEETSTQDTTSAATADINNDTEILASSPEDHETPIQDLEAGSAPDTSNEPEEPASLPAEEETSTQDTTSAASPETSNESGQHQVQRTMKHPTRTWKLIRPQIF